MIVMTVMLSRESSFRVIMIDEADVASKPLVGSSRKRAMGAAASSIPILTRFRCPPEMTGFAALPTRLSLT